MTWADGRLCGFDVETTGVDVEESRIVTAAVVYAGGGLPTVKRSWVLDPGVEVPEGASVIHGFTTERVRAEGVPAAEGIREIAEALFGDDAAAEPPPIVVFNAPFDLTMLHRELARYGIGPLDGYPYGRYVIDPLVIDKHLHRFRRGSRNLAAQAAHYGAALDEAHEASADALAACRVAWCIGKRGTIIRRVRNSYEGQEKKALMGEWMEVKDDLRLLYGAQVRWARDQLAQFREYRLSRGGEAPEHREWPYTPLNAG